MIQSSTDIHSALMDIVGDTVVVCCTTHGLFRNLDEACISVKGKLEYNNALSSKHCFFRVVANDQTFSYFDIEDITAVVIGTTFPTITLCIDNTGDHNEDE
tara:strand:+ start:175 stop:477 length:303 start_codon:yes stop_codon:yes gene_type:complete